MLDYSVHWAHSFMPVFLWPWPNFQKAGVKDFYIFFLSTSFEHELTDYLPFLYAHSSNYRHCYVCRNRDCVGCIQYSYRHCQACQNRDCAGCIQYSYRHCQACQNRDCVGCIQAAWSRGAVRVCIFLLLFTFFCYVCVCFYIYHLKLVTFFFLLLFWTVLFVLQRRRKADLYCVVTCATVGYIHWV